MSTTKAILTALWRARNARRTPPSPVAQAVTRELYRRSLADAVRLEFYAREWDESKIKRGQPGNAGQFAAKSGGSSESGKVGEDVPAASETRANTIESVKARQAFAKRNLRAFSDGDWSKVDWFMQAWEHGTGYGRHKPSKQLADDKHKLIERLQELANSKGWNWGYQHSGANTKHPWVVYFDSPEGQLSFHTDKPIGEERQFANATLDAGAKAFRLAEAEARLIYEKYKAGEMSREDYHSAKDRMESAKAVYYEALDERTPQESWGIDFPTYSGEWDRKKGATRERLRKLFDAESAEPDYTAFMVEDTDAGYQRTVSYQAGVERYRQPGDESGTRWVTIGAHDHEGGTPVQIDGQGNIVKGPPALKGQPADNPDAGKPAQGESSTVADSATFDETAANSSLSKSGKAEHGGATVEIVDHPQGKQWGYAARITKADGTVEHVSNHGQGKGTSWREAQARAVESLAKSSPGESSPGISKTPEKQAPSARELSPAQPGDQNDDSFRLERPKNAPHQPKESQGELFETKGKSDVPRGVTELPDGRRLGAAQLRVSDLKADPKRFQYKISGIDPTTGVTKELKEVKAFNPLFAGQLLVWHDPKENQSYVVNGHHRYDLARRADYGGTLNVFYIDEPSAEGARAMGALANIAEGRGTAVDAAKFMRDSGKTVGDLQASGISLQGKVASDGAVLSKMSDKIFQDLTNGLTTESRALAIGRHVSKPEVQEQLYRRLKKQESGPRAKDIPDGQVEEIAREYELAGTTTDKQTGGLFGDLESEESLVFQRAELKSFLRKEFAAERNTFKGISTKGRVARISEESGNVLNVEANRDRAQAADQALWAFNQLANRKGDIADAIQEAAEAYYHEPRKRKTIFAELRRSIIERIDLDTGGLRPDDAKRGGNAENGGIGAGDGSAGPAESTKEQFSREFARRDLVERFSRAFAERYAAGPVDVVETSVKRSKVAANYRPAFGAARCGTCEFYRARACSHVAGEIQPADMCDLYFPARGDAQAVEHFAKESPGQRHLFDESKVHRGQPGNAGQFGPGGGSQPSGEAKGGSGGQSDAKPADAPAGQPGASEAKPEAGAANDPPTAPPPGEYYSPDPSDGQSSRVGVPAFSAPPPPAVPRLPKLAPDERQAEQTFAAAYEADPDGMAGIVLAKMQAGELGDGFPNVFGTDDVKALAADWKGSTPEETLDKRSQYNTALHQTANALAKRAFVRYLDETVAKMPEGQRNVLVTSGGCAAGKGYAIGKIDEVRTVAESALSVDSEELYRRSVGYLQNAEDVKPAVKRGGTAGLRIWGESGE